MTSPFRLPASPLPPSIAVSPLSSHLPTLLTRVPVIEELSDSFWPCSGADFELCEQQGLGTLELHLQSMHAPKCSVHIVRAGAAHMMQPGRAGHILPELCN